jgi:hypothetical protein
MTTQTTDPKIMQITDAIAIDKYFTDLDAKIVLSEYDLRRWTIARGTITAWAETRLEQIFFP